MELRAGSGQAGRQIEIEKEIQTSVMHIHCVFCCKVQNRFIQLGKETLQSYYFNSDYVLLKRTNLLMKENSNDFNTKLYYACPGMSSGSGRRETARHCFLRSSLQTNFKPKTNKQINCVA
jgi:hypothetical protein